MVAPAAERHNGHDDKETDGLFLPGWHIDWTKAMRVINMQQPLSRSSGALPAFLNFFPAAVTVIGFSVTALLWLYTSGQLKKKA